MTLEEFTATFTSTGGARLYMGQVKKRYKGKEPAFVIKIERVKRNTNAHRALCHWLKVNAGQQGNKWFEMNASDATYLEWVGFMDKGHASHFLLTHGKAA